MFCSDTGDRNAGRYHLCKPQTARGRSVSSEKAGAWAAWRGGISWCSPPWNSSALICAAQDSYVQAPRWSPSCFCPPARSFPMYKYTRCAHWRASPLSCCRRGNRWAHRVCLSWTPRAPPSSPELEIALNDLPRHIDGIDEIEYLIINDGSDDDTERIALEWGVHYVVHFKRNLGLARLSALISWCIPPSNSSASICAVQDWYVLEPMCICRNRQILRVKHSKI